MRARTALLVVLAAAISAALFSAVTGLGVDDAAIAVSHQPPEENLVAGDALPIEAAAASPQCPTDMVCTPSRLTVHYSGRDGQPESVSTQARADGSRTLSASIPGADVRFPALRYWLEVTTIARPVGVDPAACATTPSPCGALTGRWPQGGVHEVAVDNQLRLSLHYPDGQPAAGVRVTAEPVGADHLWEAVTDVDGRLALTIPREDDWVTEHAGELANVFLWAFDAWPAAAPDEGQPATPDGHGLYVGTVVNLGDPDLPASHEAVQDQTFTLAPQTPTFFNAADTPCTPAEGAGSSHSCGVHAR